MMTIKRWHIMGIVLFILSTACSKKQRVMPDDMILISEGEFIMGSNDVETIKKKEQYKTTKPLYADEYPERKIFLDAFFIDRFEVTNGQLSKINKQHTYQIGKNNHPAGNMNWFDADLYCKAIDRRLPTEEEWEKAARGTKGNIYPWGNEFATSYANIGKTEIKDTTPVGMYEKGKSFFGAYDMIGNVGEWTASWYKAYPGSHFSHADFDAKQRVIRGSSWGGVGHYKLNAYDRSSFRRSADPGTAIPDVGFRCAQTP